MTDQTNKLEPCPFCQYDEIRAEGRTPIHWTVCSACGARGPLAYSADEAIAAWNRRASAPAADQEAYEQECLNMTAEGIKYWKDKYEALVAASAPAAGSVPSYLAVRDIMLQAQVFASAWSLVGGRFDTGDCLATAEAEREQLQTMVRALLAQYGSPAWQPIETAPHGENVLLSWKDWDGEWQFEVGPASWGWRTPTVSNMSRHGRATHWMSLPPTPQEGK